MQGGGCCLQPLFSLLCIFLYSYWGGGKTFITSIGSRKQATLHSTLPASNPLLVGLESIHLLYCLESLLAGAFSTVSFSPGNITQNLYLEGMCASMFGEMKACWTFRSEPQRLGKGWLKYGLQAGSGPQSHVIQPMKLPMDSYIWFQRTCGSINCHSFQSYGNFCCCCSFHQISGLVGTPVGKTMQPHSPKPAHWVRRVGHHWSRTYIQPSPNPSQEHTLASRITIDSLHCQISNENTFILWHLSPCIHLWYKGRMRILIIIDPLIFQITLYPAWQNLSHMHWCSSTGLDPIL